MKKELINKIESAKTEADLLEVRKKIADARFTRQIADADRKELLNRLANKSRKLITPAPLTPHTNFLSPFK